MAPDAMPLLETLGQISALVEELDEESRNQLEFGATLAELARDDIALKLPPPEELTSTLSSALDLCRQYFAAGSADSFWAEASSHGVNFNDLCSLLYLWVDSAQIVTADQSERRVGFIAAQLYLVLCSLNGAAAHGVFKNFLYDRCLESLSFACKLIKRSQEHDTPEKRSRGRTRSRKTRADDDEDDEEPSSQGTRSTSPSMSDEQLDELRTLAASVLKRLWSFLGRQPDFARQHEECYLRTIDVVSDLLPLDSASASANRTVNALSEHDLKHRNSSELVFALLHRLCRDNVPAARTVAIRQVLRSLLRFLLPIGIGTNAHLRQLTLGFVASLVEVEQEEQASVVRVLVQNLCAKCPERAEARRIVIEEVIRLSFAVSVDEFRTIFDWFFRFGRNSRASYRLFAVELHAELVRIFCEESRLGEEERSVCKKRLVTAVLARCSDRATFVRAKALSAVAVMLGASAMSGDEEMRSVLLSLGTPVMGAQSRIGVANRDLPAVDDEQRTCERALETPCGQSMQSMNSISFVPISAHGISLLDNDGLVSLLVRRGGDEKSHVRKAALAALEAFVLLVPELGVNVKNIKVFEERCCDPGLSIRKQAAESLARLLQAQPLSTVVQKAFIRSILPMCTDREQAVQDRAVQLFCENVLEKVQCGEEGAWEILAEVETSRESMRYVTRILQQVLKVDDARTVRRLVAAAETRMDATDDVRVRAACWMLLAEFAGRESSFGRAVDAWFLLDGEDHNVRHVARILAKQASVLNNADVGRLIDDVRRRLEGCFFDVANVAAVVYLLAELEQVMNKQATLGDLMEEFAAKIVEDCEVLMSGRGDEQRCARMMLTAAELAQYCARVVTAGLRAGVEAIVAAEEGISSQGVEQMPRETDTLQLAPSKQASVVPDRRESRGFSPFVCATAVIALGKLCLQDESAAKSSVTLLIEKIRCSPSAAVRNNVIVVLADFGVRYTSIIDRHLDEVTLALKDRSALVRKQTLCLLTSLLKEDYLKFRGPLFARVLGALLDDDEDVRDFANFCIVQVLVQRQPTLLSTHFIETLFYLNEFHGAGDALFGQAWRANIDKRFSLSDASEARWKLYQFMLVRCTVVQRFQLTLRLCQDVLSNVVEGVFKLDNEAVENVLADTLRILASKEIKISSAAAHGTADDDADEDGDGDRAVNALCTAITQDMKRTMTQAVLPIVVECKRVLEREQSVLLHPLMVFLVELVREYKTEFGELFEADRKLAAELHFELKRFGEESPSAGERRREERVATPRRVLRLSDAPIDE